MKRVSCNIGTNEIKRLRPTERGMRITLLDHSNIPQVTYTVNSGGIPFRKVKGKVPY